MTLPSVTSDVTERLRLRTRYARYILLIAFVHTSCTRVSQHVDFDDRYASVNIDHAVSYADCICLGTDSRLRSLAFGA